MRGSNLPVFYVALCNSSVQPGPMNALPFLLSITGETIKEPFKVRLGASRCV